MHPYITIIPNQTHKIKMEIEFKPLLFMFFLFISISYAEDNVLKNPDFEDLPTANGTSQFMLLNKTNSNNTIPGWSYNGTVYYVTSGNNLSFPANGGHAIQLGRNGRINQTFRGTKDVLDYVLSFNLAVPNEDCADKYYITTAVNITVYETIVIEGSIHLYERSGVFYYGRNFSRRLWETNAFYLGQFGSYDYVNVEIKSMTMNNTEDHNVTSNCWPLVDAFSVKRNHLQIWYDDNILANGDFEIGPSFLNNSFDGILLHEEQDTFNSPLQEWFILGTIKYINSKNYKVPRGKAAIELLSEYGYPSGIKLDLNLRTTLTYTLNFTMGDANDSCVGDFLLYVQIGMNVTNYTMNSYGNGSAFRYSMTFKVESSLTPTSIVFYISNETRTSDGVLCGPVLDHIVLVSLDHVDVVGSYGDRVEIMYNGVLVLSFLIAYLVILAI